jgi:hypothetical protein
MSLCFYDVLESTLLDIEKWKADSNFTKEDVLDATRKRVVMLMRHVQTTPMIGSAYAYPGDLDLSEILKLYDEGITPTTTLTSRGGSSS